MKFNALAGPADALLSIAPVAALGFLGTNPGGTIIIQGSTLAPGVPGSVVGPNVTFVGRDRTVGGTTTPGIAITGAFKGNQGTDGVTYLISVGQLTDPDVGGEVNVPKPSIDPFLNVPAFSLSGFGGGGNVRIESLNSNNLSILTPPNGTVAIGQASAGGFGTGEIHITTGTLDIDQGISASSGFQAGPIDLTAATSFRLNGSISGSSGAFGADVTIKSPSVLLTPNAQISTNTDVMGSGPVIFDVGTIEISKGARINTTEFSRAGVGDITIQGFAGAGSRATSVNIAGSITSQVSSSGIGRGGDIIISSQNINLSNGATLSARSDGSSTAGSIHLISGRDITVTNSLLETSSAAGSGGNITLTAPNLIHIVDSRLTSSVKAGSSNSGNITIDPQLVVIQNSKILANADAGAGGIITITATGAVLVDPNSRIDASAGPAGISGNVNINSPIQVLSGALVPLNLAYSQAGLSGDRCAADPNGQFSSFVQTGRDGVPQVPGALAPSPLSFLDTLTSGSWGSQVPNVATARLGLDSVSVDDSTRFRFYSACRSEDGGHHDTLEFVRIPVPLMLAAPLAPSARLGSGSQSPI